MAKKISNNNGGQSLGKILGFLSIVLLALVFLLKTSLFHKSLGVIFASSTLTVLFITPLVIKLALKAGAMDYPGGRRIHTSPTPRWGGIAVYCGVIVALLLTSMNFMPNLKAMLIGSTMILIVGLLDDVFSIKASIKLLVQVAACIVLIHDNVHVTFMPATWWGDISEWLITIIWIVGITNAINFLDGMDGLVPGLVTGTSMIYFILSMLTGSVMLAYCSIAMFGASLAFLSYNVKPARIFLGDGGSNFLGFFMATLSIHGTWAQKDPLVSYFIPILILSVPIYDMTFTTINRIFTNKINSFTSWLEYTGKDHIHHRLESLGMTRGWVVMSICFINMAIGLGAITLYEARTYGGIALIVQAVCIYIFVALLEILGERH